MSLLVRAAVLGGLAYVVSRAIRKSDGSTLLNRSDVGRRNKSDEGSMSSDFDQDSDIGLQKSNQPSIV